jgi:hypothetical protein
MSSALFGGRRSPGDSTAPRIRWPRERNGGRSRKNRACRRPRERHSPGGSQQPTATNPRMPGGARVHIAALERLPSLRERPLPRLARLGAPRCRFATRERERKKERDRLYALAESSKTLGQVATYGATDAPRTTRQTGTRGLLSGSIALPGMGWDGGRGVGGWGEGRPRFGARGFTERVLSASRATSTNFHQIIIIAPCRCSCPARNEVRGNSRSRVRTPLPTPPVCLPLCPPLSPPVDLGVETSEADHREGKRGIRVGFSAKSRICTGNRRLIGAIWTATLMTPAD